MATYTPESVHSAPAAADLSGNQYCFMVLNGSSEAALCGAGQRAHGVISNLPEQGEQCRYDKLGPQATLKVRGGAAIPKNTEVSSDAQGRMKAAVAGEHILGITFDAAVTGAITRFIPEYRGVKA